MNIAPVIASLGDDASDRGGDAEWWFSGLNPP